MKISGIPLWAWILLAIVLVFLLAKAVQALFTLAIAALVVYVVYRLLISKRGSNW